MGLDDIVDKAKDFAGDAADKAKDLAGDAAGKAKDLAGDVKEKAEGAIHSDTAEKISDTVLDGGEKAANFVTGGKQETKIGGVRDDLDAKIGNDDDAKPAASGGGTGA